MAEKAYLVIDCGASSGRAIVARYDGRRFTLEETHRFENRPVRAAGTLYWDILRLFSEVGIGVQKSQKACGALASMAIDTWGVDFGLVDAAGKLLANPVHYRDARRNGLAEEACGVIPRHELFGLTGTPVFSIMTLFNLYAMKKDGASELEKASRFLMVPDLLAWLLTGEQVNEYSNACTTVLYNQAAKRWEGRILDAYGLPRNIFGTAVMPGTRVGPVGPAVCADLGVSPVMVTAPASHDTASAVAGVPARASDPPWAYISIGTWGVVGRETGAPVLDRAVYDAGWGNEGGADGNCFLAVNVAGLFPVQQCRQKWVRDAGRDIGWDEIVRTANMAPRLATVIDIDDPAFAPVSADMPGVLAEYCGRHGLRRPEGMGAIARAFYEGLALKFRHRLAQLRAFGGPPIELVRMVGGGTQNEQLCQWTADASGLPVEAGPVETTVAGNLIAQLMGDGEISTLAEGREIVARSSTTRRYVPRDTAAWDDAYARLPGRKT